MNFYATEFKPFLKICLGDFEFSILVIFAMM